MAEENLVTCYKGIQRIYRNAVVGFLRKKLKEIYPEEYEAKLRSPFFKEWDAVKKNAMDSRLTGEVEAGILDDFDLLGTNHFFNLFDVYYEDLLSSDPTIPPETRKRQKQTLLNWMRTIKTMRDPLSHPSEQDLSDEDCFQFLDCARRVLMRLALVDEASEIASLIAEVYGDPAVNQSGRPQLDDSLPPRESIVVQFVGRNRELEELEEWFMDPVSRRWALAGEGGKGKTAIAYNFAVNLKLLAPPPFQAVFWLSAKKRKFVEGSALTIETPDFSDLDSALSRLLVHYGWIEETSGSVESKKVRVLELLNEFPALIIVDDVDSLESEDENVIEFFSLQVPSTRSKVLFTSRRTIFGMGGSTTHVSGFKEEDAASFILSRCRIMEMDHAAFTKSVIKEVLRVTEGSPLFIEDLMRLTTTVGSLGDAIGLWAERKGQAARRYALGRECDLLTPEARKVLFASSVTQGPVSFVELETITGLSQDIIISALQELQKLFLVPKPRLIEGEQRFEVNVNTRSLIREVYGGSELFQRVQAAYKAISEDIPQTVRGPIGALIKQAMYLLKAQKRQDAENLLLDASKKYPDNPDLLGFLGFVYKSWQPSNRVTDAREKFKRAAQLKCKKQDMYEHWCKMELKQQEWIKAIDAAEKGLKILGEDRMLHYLCGYARSRVARELYGGLHLEKAKTEASAAKELLKKALKSADTLEIGERELNADIYRALVLTCEILDDVKGIKHYFSLWRSEHPDDPNGESEWLRVSRKYPGLLRAEHKSL